MDSTGFKWKMVVSGIHGENPFGELNLKKALFSLVFTINKFDLISISSLNLCEFEFHMSLFFVLAVT